MTITINCRSGLSAVVRITQIGGNIAATTEWAGAPATSEDLRDIDEGVREALKAHNGSEARLVSMQPYDNLEARDRAARKHLGGGMG